MNKDLIDAFQTLIAKLITTAETLATSEIPALLQEMLTWTAISCLSKAVIFFILIAIICGIIKRIMIDQPEDKRDTDDLGIAIGLGIFALSFAGALYHYLFWAIKCWIAPRVALIEILKDYLN